MNDNEARGLILKRIYDRRNTSRFVHISNLDDLGFDTIALDRYLTQLDSSGLITLKPLRGDSGLVDAMIQITSYGSDAVEHPETSPSNVVINIGELHIGDRKTQEIKMGVGKVEAAMDDSTISKVEHKERKSVVDQLLEFVKRTFFGS